MSEQLDDVITRILHTGKWDMELWIDAVSRMTTAVIRSPNGLYKYQAVDRVPVKALLAALEKANE